MRSQDFIKVARDLLAVRQGKPSQVHLRRAVSTAYYAVFHEICKMNADALIAPQGNAPKMSRAWRQTYRALNHGAARRACKAIEDEPTKYNFPNELQTLGLNFSSLQKDRHEADYDPSKKFKIPDVEKLIDHAENAIKEVGKVQSKHKKAFATFLLMLRR